MNNSYSISKNFSLSREKIRNIENYINILNYLDMFSFLADQNDELSPIKNPAQYIFDFFEGK
jgi:hypothetical protein